MLRMEIIIPLFIALFIALAIFGARAAAKRRKELEAWAQARGLRFSAESDYGFDERFPNFECLQHGHARYAYNTLAGDWEGRGFLGFDGPQQSGRGRPLEHHSEHIRFHEGGVLRGGGCGDSPAAEGRYRPAAELAGAAVRVAVGAIQGSRR